MCDVKSEVIGHTVEYTITGTIADVEREIDTIKGRFPPAGYGTWFHWPIQKGNSYCQPQHMGGGVIRVRGHRSTST